jgi:hypothetical protein
MMKRLTITIRYSDGFDLSAAASSDPLIVEQQSSVDHDSKYDSGRET